MQERFVFDVLFTSHSALGARVLTRVPAQIFWGGGGLRLRFSQMQSKFLAFRYTRVFLFWIINKYMNQGRQASWFTMWASFRSPCLKASGSVPVLRLLLFSAGIDPSCKGTLSRSGVGCSRSVLLIPFLLAVVKTFQQGIWMRGARASLIQYSSLLRPSEKLTHIDSSAASSLTIMGEKEVGSFYS